MSGTGGATMDEDAAAVRRPCHSCEGALWGHEPGGVCQGCLDDWARWRRNEREAVARYVDAQLADAARRRVGR